MAGRDARLAARASIEIDLEGELLAWSRRGRRQEGGVIAFSERLSGFLMKLSEPLDGAQVALLEEERTQQAIAAPEIRVRRLKRSSRGDGYRRTFIVEAHKRASLR
jgi:hypothetical protein